jgi:hypothetical protein
MHRNIDIDPDLLREAEALAERTQRTLSAVFEDGLRRTLEASSTESKGRPRRRLSLPTSPGVPLPGINFDSNEALLDVMEPIEELRAKYAPSS